MNEEEAILRGWHLDKRVSISHIITTLTVSCAIMVWIFSLDGRVKVNEVRIDAMVIQDNIIRSELSKLGDDIIGKLDKMRFDRIYSAWRGRMIPDNAKKAVDRSAKKYISAISD